MIYGGNMVKEIEVYEGKKILVDFDKVRQRICDIFILFLFCAFLLMPNLTKIIGLESRNFLLILVSFITMTLLVGTNILEGKIKVNKYNIILFGYLVSIILSYFFSSYKSGALLGTNGRGEGVVGLISYMICFYITYNGFKYDKKIFKYVTIAVVILSGYGAVQALLSDNFVSFGTRPYMGQSNFGNPNTFSSFLMLVIPIYLVKYYYCKEKIYLLVLTIIFAGMIGTKTFAGYITGLFVLIIITAYFIVIWKNKKEIMLKFLKLLLSFAIVFALFNIVNDNAYIGEIGENKAEIELVTSDKAENQEGTTNKQKFGNNRGYIWGLSCEIISKHPVFGVGPDSLGCEVKSHYMNREDYIFGNAWVDKAHSEYLHIAATTGIPSLIIYVVFLFTILIGLLVKYIKYVKEGKVLEKENMILVAVTGSIVAYIIQAAANISMFAVAPLFWAMLGIGAEIASKNEKQEEI